MDNWIVTIISGTIGAIIGTYGGAFFLNYWQNRKIRKIRNIAIKALKIILEYKKKSFSNAENQFNTLTISEKRAVIVALHKLGLPIGLVLPMKYLTFAMFISLIGLLTKTKWKA